MKQKTETSARRSWRDWARALNPLRGSGHFVADALYAACVGAAVGMAGALLWGALG